MESINTQPPFVLIDRDRLQTNLHTMKKLCDRHGLSLRANVSTHGSISIAQQQLDMGAMGISCLTVREAREFVEAGFTDIQIPANIVGADEREALTDLMMMAKVTVTVDHTSVVAGLADASGQYDLSVRVLIEIAHREGYSGLSPAEVVTLAKRVESEENLHFAGVYMQPITPQSFPRLQETLKQLDSVGLGVDVVSGGGTGLPLMAAAMPDVTEVVAGRYALYDWQSIINGWCHPDECALKIRSTIVNRPSPDRAMINAGWRHLSMFNINNTYGHILEYPHAIIYRLDPHRAYVDTSRCNEQPVIGETVHIIPISAEAVLHQTQQIYTIKDDHITPL